MLSLMVVTTRARIQWQSPSNYLFSVKCFYFSELVMWMSGTARENSWWCSRTVRFVTGPHYLQLKKSRMATSALFITAWAERRLIILSRRNPFPCILPPLLIFNALLTTCSAIYLEQEQSLFTGSPPIYLDIF